MIRLLSMVLLGGVLLGQEVPDNERADLRAGLSEAGSSQVEFIRAIERHLQKYPKTEQRPELERALVKAASEVRDTRRILLYGERVLSREPANAELLERVARQLLSTDDAEAAGRALGYARKLEQTVREQAELKPGTPGAAAQWEQRQIVLAKALVYQSRATGNQGNFAEALALARKSFEEAPSAESAREIARWLDKSGKTAEAIPHLCDAFMLSDQQAEAEGRAKDRTRLGEWQKKINGSETGLGDQLLAAFDRVKQLVDGRKAKLRAIDPNVFVNEPMEFTISGLDGEKLELAKLRGKVIVLDFWATWCGPCRAQQPLYEQVKKRFDSNKNVVFLNLSTDEDRSLVKPFLAKSGWNKTVYFDDGLAGLLRVSSIPTTVVFNGRGEVSARMNGYIMERFTDMLADRIQQALNEK
ncbi:MAG: thioredoxin-like domain-containing protein [Acidobacteriota bacterium]